MPANAGALRSNPVHDHVDMRGLGVAGMVAACGLFFSVWLFYPGLTTHDALAVYDQAHAGSFGDWQPPLMGVLWVWLEQVFGYGPQALFLPTIILYWAGFFLVFAAIRESGSRFAWLLLLVAMSPPVFCLIGILWRDVIFSVLWLDALGLAMLAAGRRGAARLALSVPAVGLFLIGYWLRPNALFAAAPLLVGFAWPRDWLWKRQIALAIPIVALLVGSTYVVNYLWLRAKEDHVVHSIFVFDLAGITHFSGANAFPIPEWTPAEIETVSTVCYQPSYWDAMWWPACTFAMERINRDIPAGTKLFGSPALRDAWARAIIAHPLAYLQHRFAHFWALMTGENMVLFNQSASGQWRFFAMKSSLYPRFESATLWLHHNTPLFRGLTWLLLSLAVGFAGLRLSPGRARAAVVSLTVSGTLYTLTYFFFGVAAEYRYVYWTALSSLVAGVIILAKWDTDRPSFQRARA